MGLSNIIYYWTIETVNFSSDNEDNDDINIPGTRNYDRMCGIRFFGETKTYIELNENALYIMTVTRNRLYQFISPGLTSFKQIFGIYESILALFYDSVKYSIKKEKSNLMELI